VPPGQSSSRISSRPAPRNHPPELPPILTTPARWAPNERMGRVEKQKQEITWHSEAMAELDRTATSYEEMLGDIATKIATDAGRSEVIALDVAHAAALAIAGSLRDRERPMATNEHTPGPWSMKPPLMSGASLFAEVFSDATEHQGHVGTFSCVLPNEPGGEEIRYERYKADARLIAAAPELLASLNAIIEDLDTCPDCLDYQFWTEARAAIAKATS
jgi:hypothetical protein